MVFRAVLSALFMVLGLAVGPVSAEVLVLGSVNDNVRKHVKRFTPLAEYLKVELAEHGVSDVEISVQPSSEAMVAALAAGEVDLYFDSPLVAANVVRQSGARPFLRRWKRGVASYHSLIVVRSESDIRDLEDLVGRKIGFQDPDSTSGYLLPMDLILGRGLPVAELAGHLVPANEAAVSYVFTRDDKNTVLWLTRGWIDAAATDPNGFSKLEEAFPGQFRELARSIDVPRQTVIKNEKMDPALAAALEIIRS